MAKKYCTYIPSKGASLFKDLKKSFGYEMARKIFLTAINPKFISNYKNTLSLDAEGIPTIGSVLNNKYIKDLVGNIRMTEALNNKYVPMQDTIENYGILLNNAYQFNTSDEQKDSYVAVVEPIEDNKLALRFYPKTDDAVNKFNNQYSSHRLNTELANIFSPLGITVGNLTQAEISAGRVGVTDFTKAKDMANGFSSLIRVANNIEGAEAISEEFSHLIVGVFRDSPLVERSINSLQNNEEALKQILGEHYEDVKSFYNGDISMVAEEAIGHILRKNLQSDLDNIDTPAPSLFKRLINFIVNKFKRFSLSDVQKAILDADSSMDKLAKNILSKSMSITQEDIKRSERNAQFNALSDRIDRNIEILKNAAKVEAKRFKITTGLNRSAVEQNIDDILNSTATDTVEGLFNYAKQALDQLRVLDVSFAGIGNMTPTNKFRFLRDVRTYIQSYGGFIHAMNKAINEESEEADNLFLRDFEIDGNIVSISNIITELNGLSNQLSDRYAQVALPSFAEFLKPYLGNNIVIPFGKNAGKEITIEQLLTEAEGDISFLDRWLDSMADSSDVLLQLFDSVYKKQLTKTRLSTIDKIREIQDLRREAESMGITDFEWMFDKDDDGHKSGYYISKVRLAQFEKDKKEFDEYLEDKYGTNPTGQAAIDKIAERNAWYSQRATSIFGNYVPDPVLYKNEDYDDLSDNQKTILNKFLRLKGELDALLPRSRVTNLKAIQIRKNSGQRLLDSMSSAEGLFNNIKEGIASEFLDRADDDTLFGHNRAKKGMVDFAGNEFMLLPVLYTTMLENKDELTTDVFGSLMQYSYMAYNYHNLEEVIDPLEVGRTLVSEVRNVRKTRGGESLIEKFESLDLTVVNKILQTKGSNIEQKLNDFFESKIYGMYLKDEGAFDVFGNKVNVNKGVSFILKASSLAQLGFNWLANLANLTNGVAMQNIEAAAGEYFNVKELASADKSYISEMKDYCMEIGQRINTSKLHLFDELFNIKQDYNRKVKDVQSKNWLKRIFGENIAFLGQDAGDHWLYNRTAIAMAKRKQVIYNGQTTSLWEALQVIDDPKHTGQKKLNIDDITELDGSKFDIHAFSEEVADVNQNMFGIYNDADAVSANRFAMGRLLMQYRKWMKPAFNRRFQAGQYNVSTGKYTEGYYRTLLRIGNELFRGQLQWGMLSQQLTEHEKKNVIRSITEVLQCLFVWALANWIEWPDDKNRPWHVKLAEYLAKRTAHELGGMTPSTVMLQEQLKTVKQPIPSISVIQNALNLVNSLISPEDYVDEIDRGPYKGMSTLEKNILKAPIPGVMQYRQIDKFVHELDNSINYYARPY